MLVSGCRPGREADLRFPGAPVVLISIDTLRADRLPAWGYTKGETPAIDAFRKDAILYSNALSHVPLTLPSHATIFTGLLPVIHGIRDNRGYRLEPSAGTLASLLKDAGYATGGAVSSIVLARASDIARGFDFWEDTIEPTHPNQFVGQVQRPGAATAAILEGWLGALPPDRPFLAFLHVYEPHSPYEPPEPFRSRLADPYDGEVAAADAAVGGFLDFLKRKGLYDRSLIVLLSDHGEGLNDHGEDEHGIFLYREALHVPLLVKVPGAARRGTTVSETAGLMDVAPTVLSVLGVARPKGLESGVSLLELGGNPAVKERALFAETLFPRLHLGWSELSSLMDARFHYIDAPRAEFFDYAADPAEKTNIAGEKPPVFRSMLFAMEKIDRSFTRPKDVDPEEAKKLASLGYISTGARTEGSHIDPKDQIGTFRTIKDAFAAYAAGRDGEAARLFAGLLEENPAMVDMWDAQAHALMRLGRKDESLAAIRKAIEASVTGAPGLLVSAANLYFDAGKIDEALAHARLAAERGDAGADDLLSRLSLAKGDFTGAEASAKRSLEAAPTRRLPYLVLARSRLAQGDLPGALRWTDEALRKTREGSLAPIMTLHQIHGDILGRLERGPEAEAAFRDEIRLFPANDEARMALALLLAAENRLPEARHALEEMVQRSPDAATIDRAIRVLTIVGDGEGAAAWKRRKAGGRKG